MTSYALFTTHTFSPDDQQCEAQLWAFNLFLIIIQFYTWKYCDIAVHFCVQSIVNILLSKITKC